MKLIIENDNGKFRVFYEAENEIYKELTPFLGFKRITATTGSFEIQYEPTSPDANKLTAT